MKKFFVGVFTLFFLLPILHNQSAIYAQALSTIKGVVYHDKNMNGELDSSDKPLKGIAVSNGRDVVLTNRKGEYEIPLSDNSSLFVIKPRNWSVKVDEKQVPRFYKMH